MTDFSAALFISSQNSQIAGVELFSVMVELRYHNLTPLLHLPMFLHPTPFDAIFLERHGRFAKTHEQGRNN